MSLELRFLWELSASREVPGPGEASPFQCKSAPGPRPPSCRQAPATAVHALPKQAVRMVPARTSRLPGSSRTPEAEVVEEEEAWRLTVRALGQSPAPLWAPSTIHLPLRSAVGARGQVECGWEGGRWQVKRSHSTGRQPHLSKHIQQPDGASRLPAKDRGDHGVHAATAHATVLPNPDAGQHGDQGHQGDEGHQKHARKHACVSLRGGGEARTQVSQGTGGSTDHHPYALRGEPTGKRQRQHHRGEAWKKFQVSRVFLQQTLQDFQALTSQVKATSYPHEAPPGLSPLHLPTLPPLSRQLPHRCTGCPSGDLTAPSPPPSYPWGSHLECLPAHSSSLPGWLQCILQDRVHFLLQEAVPKPLPPGSSSTQGLVPIPVLVLLSLFPSPSYLWAVYSRITQDLGWGGGGFFAFSISLSFVHMVHIYYTYSPLTLLTFKHAYHLKVIWVFRSSMH